MVKRIFRTIGTLVKHPNAIVADHEPETITIFGDEEPEEKETFPYQGRWGFHTVEYESYRRLKLVHKHLWNAWFKHRAVERQMGKEPQNRKKDCEKILDPLFSTGSNNSRYSSMKQFFPRGQKPNEEEYIVERNPDGSGYFIMDGTFLTDDGAIMFHSMACDIVDAFRLAKTPFKTKEEVPELDLNHDILEFWGTVNVLYEALCQREEKEKQV